MPVSRQSVKVLPSSRQPFSTAFAQEVRSNVQAMKELPECLVEYISAPTNRHRVNVVRLVTDPAKTAPEKSQSVNSCPVISRSDRSASTKSSISGRSGGYR